MTIESTDEPTTTAKFISEVSGKNYQVDGPLARAYTDALHEIYGKKIDPETGLALETQALDAQYAQTQAHNRLAQLILNNNELSDVSLLYGVQKRQATVQDLIDVTDKMATLTPEAKLHSAVIFDTAITNENTGEVDQLATVRINPFETALEQMCKRHNVATYSSLTQFIKLHQS